MTNEKAPDLYIGTDENGDTIIGTGVGLLPWVELDELLAARYPDEFPSAEQPRSVIVIRSKAA
jgi:hypothetical protein